MESNTMQSIKMKVAVLFIIILLFPSCYQEKDDKTENLFLVALLQRIVSAEAENCSFNTIGNGTLLEDSLNDVQLKGTQEILTASEGYKDISNYSVNLLPTFIIDITLRELPANGLPAFPAEPLDTIISAYILDLKTDNNSFTIKLERPSSTNPNVWPMNTTRPVVLNNKTNSFFACLFPTISGNTIRIGCDQSFFNFNQASANVRLQSIHKDRERTFSDCR
ncbi:MAG: hypothetical protein GW938_02010 [Leptospira sp.]|nr:hypothetical protein [Leptospira sp.]NCS92878.1 hypothetical protein [Leptospira sp.]